MGEEFHTLSIVIPALNEQDAIASTIRRCLDAREHIVQKTRVREVELIVVSDGSTDRTEEIARGFDEVTVLAFERNRGYGAAIKCGFEYGRGDLVGFLDADGTCDPRVFADLCSALDEHEADVVLGSRLGPGSEMPRIRAVGNTLFAVLLGVLGKQAVADTASGMRVLRRRALPDLHPLPDGLHFTPAMSARILLEDKLRLVEVPMPYAERVGRSKLSVLRDGVRFFTTILQAAVTYRPARLLLMTASGVAAAGLLVGIRPTVHYLRNFELEEWMIYRILLASLLATVLWLLLAAATVAERIAATAAGRPPASTGVTGAVGRLFTRRSRRVGSVLLTGAAVATVWPGIVEYLTRGEVEMHWSRAVLASLLVVGAATIGVATFLLNMMDLIEARRVPGGRAAPADRVRPAGGAG